MRIVPLLGVGLILSAWAVWFLGSNPSALFSQYHDDTLLLASARALAEGRGYVVPSIPGSPVQTKYPILYPWLLSLVWRIDPVFPANLPALLAVTAAFACLAIAAAWLLLRRLGLPEGWALAFTALTAFHPIFLVLSGKILTDVPMMALTLLTVLAAERALDPRQRWQWTAVTGILAAAAILTRTVGVTLVAAVLLVAVWRRRFRVGLGFLAICLPLVVAGLWVPGDNRALDALAVQAPQGFQHNWFFYTSYLKYWKLSVPDLDAFAHLAADNVIMFLLTPALYFQFPPQAGLWAILYMAFSVFLLLGIYAHGRTCGLRVIHVVFVFHTAIILAWTNREMVERFFLPFLPLFCVGLWHLGRQLPLRRASGALAAVLLVMFLFRGLAASAAYDHSLVTEFTPRMASLAAEKEELYQWIRLRTSQEDRFIAWDDGGLWLHTGRQGMRPAAFSTEYYYWRTEQILDRDMRTILDTARQIEARYWVRVEGEYADRRIEQRIDGLVRPLPVLFRSRAGRVCLYDLTALVRAS